MPGGRGRGRAGAGGWLAVRGGGKRDQRLDFLRGYCVVAMAVDHLGANSWLALLTGGNRFFVSAAEGFLFLSGLVMGVVYRPLVARAGLGAAAGKALRRALLLYALTVGATLGFMALSAGLGLPWGRGVDAGAALGAVLALRRTYYLTDVLLLYTVLVALAPAAFALLRRRGGWAALLGLSWGSGTAPLRPIQLPWPSEDNAFYYIAAWQVLFWNGLALGWHRERVGAAAGRLGAWRVLAGGAGGVAALVAVWAWLSGDVGRVDAGVAERAWAEYAKWSLPPGRLVACLVVFAFAFALVDRCWGPLRAGWGGWCCRWGGRRWRPTWCTWGRWGADGGGAGAGAGHPTSTTAGPHRQAQDNGRQRRDTPPSPRQHRRRGRAGRGRAPTAAADPLPVPPAASPRSRTAPARPRRCSRTRPRRATGAGIWVELVQAG